MLGIGLGSYKKPIPTPEPENPRRGRDSKREMRRERKLERDQEGGERKLGKEIKKGERVGKRVSIFSSFCSLYSWMSPYVRSH